MQIYEESEYRMMDKWVLSDSFYSSQAKIAVHARTILQFC